MFSLFKSFVFDLQKRLPNDGITAEEIEDMAKRDRFSKYLPYRIFDPDEHCYYNGDDSFGFLWELSPLVYANKATYDGIEQIMKDVPFGTNIQAIICADPYIDPLIDQYPGGAPNRIPDGGEDRQDCSWTPPQRGLNRRQIFPPGFFGRSWPLNSRPE